MSAILKITNLCKEYESVIALNDVSLEIERGTIFGLLGPNGAGKTSLIRILTGITLPDRGSFTLDYTDRKDFDTLSRMIGYLPEERGLYPDMKIKEQLEFLGEIKGLSLKDCRSKIQQYSERLGTSGWLDKKANELSKGMQQMVQFMATIFFEPSLIVLDEPFTGLDPINTNKMKSEILELQKTGTTIIFSTHRMEQVEEICENIALINKGKIILEGDLADVKKRFKKDIYQVCYAGEMDSDREYEFEVIERSVSAKESSMIVRDKSQNSSANILLKKLIEHVEVHSFVEILPSLNEIFITQVNEVGSQSTTQGETDEQD